VKELFLLALAGGMGALSRYFVSSWITNRIAAHPLPWGTFIVNVLGCFLFGILWILARERSIISPKSAFYILTGFIGSFTTFSTFTFEVFLLFQQLKIHLAFLYLIGSQIIGLVAAWAGIMFGRTIPL
jgi:CrcB protein